MYRSDPFEVVFGEGAIGDQIQKAIDDAHAAGVAEGIRQAREAVASTPVHYLNPLVPVLGQVDVLAALDALETT